MNACRLTRAAAATIPVSQGSQGPRRLLLVEHAATQESQGVQSRLAQRQMIPPHRRCPWVPSLAAAAAVVDDGGGCDSDDDNNDDEEDCEDYDYDSEYNIMIL